MRLRRVDWRRIAHYGFWVVVIGLALNAGRLAILRSRAQQLPLVAPVPYTVILMETVFDVNGVAKAGLDVMWAIRSDGSRAFRSEGKGESQRIVEFASGERVTIDELREMKSSTVEKGTNAAKWLRDPKQNCVGSLAGEPITSGQVVLGEETVGGYRAVKVAKGNITWWFALDCGCAMLKSRASFGNRGVSEKNVVALIPGEPQALLFHVPKSFREVPPSEMMGGSSPDLLKLDQWYDAHRSQ